ncbi:MAG: DUF2076 domain-containing protein [Hyphomicrobiales bacterium]|nr:DUF2076 domain-containing protein [Hyphomicrobiales bacterium]
MDRTEQDVIDELFGKLSEAEQGSAQRDAGAEKHINKLISRQPAAPYYMAQAIIVQEQALKQAQQRIEELENDVDERPAAGGGSFLGGLFGGGSVPRSGGATPGSRYPAQNRGRQPESPVQQYQRTGQGGGFLAGAAQTAVGVAGGMMLGSMLGGMFGGGDKATAAEPAKAEDTAKDDASNNDNAETQDASNDGGGWFDGGGDDSDI